MDECEKDSCRTSLKPELLSKLAHIASEHQDVWALYLFGSHAKGKATEQSDIDLGVLFNPTLNEEQVWSLRLQLADRFSTVGSPRQVDLVVMGEDLDLSFRILRQGIKLYVKNHDEVCSREATLASMYYDFKPFLDAYLRGVAKGFRAVG